MKRWVNIMLSLTLPILLLFGSGGLTLVTCACSGHTTMAMPFEQGCCRSDSPCMSVTHVQLSEGEVLMSTDIPHQAVSMTLAWVDPMPTVVDTPETWNWTPPPLPPPQSARPAVLRV